MNYFWNIWLQELDKHNNLFYFRPRVIDFIEYYNIELITDLEFSEFSKFLSTAIVPNPLKRSVRVTCWRSISFASSLNILVIKWLWTSPSDHSSVNKCHKGNIRNCYWGRSEDFFLITRFHWVPLTRHFLVMTRAMGMLIMKNSVRIFRGYFNRKRVRRKSVCVKIF